MYRTGLRRGIDTARVSPPVSKTAEATLEAQASDAGYERSRLLAKLADNDKVIDDLKRQLSEQINSVRSLQSVTTGAARPVETHQESNRSAGDSGKLRDGELAAAQAKLAELQKALDAATSERAEATGQAAVLQAKITELTELMGTASKLSTSGSSSHETTGTAEHDRDIRELMGVMTLADVHDVSRERTRPMVELHERKS